MIDLFEEHCKSEFLKQKKVEGLGLNTTFFKSLTYSFFSGGKRFRPRIMLSLAQDMGVPLKKMLPAAMALELIHTYSLVHDDLPAMDNDTYRRDKLTHHARYGEASAVLAGDALLTMAFGVLAEAYSGKILKDLILKLSDCAGSKGMVGGQVLDCLTTKRSPKIFEEIHLLKTAKIFDFASFAVACVGDFDRKKFSDLGLALGLLFQLQDDLFDEDKKGDRPEENILSVVSREDLIKKIEDQKKKVKENMSALNLKNEGAFFITIEKLFSRTY